MPAPRNRPHVFVTNPPVAEGFTSRRSGRGHPAPRHENRVDHAEHLRAALIAAEQRGVERAAGVRAAGILVTFQAPPGVDLKLDSLESRRAGIELRGVAQMPATAEQPSRETATVFIPSGKASHFLNRFEEYGTANTRTGKPKNRDLVDRIAGIQLATLRALWTDDPAAFPAAGTSVWWEVWLCRDEGREVERLTTFAARARVPVSPRRLVFDDRTVCLVYATPENLAASLPTMTDLAEVRKAKTGNAFFVDLSPPEQAEWADDLIGRLTPPPPEAPAVCVLDTGVTQAHPLIEPGLAAEDATAVDAAWGSHDNGGGPTQAGHGTNMAGLALYGDLGPILGSTDTLVLRHRLESVKILPPTGLNHPDLYGAITAQAASRPEIQAPERRRVFSMAITAPADGGQGQPTSWSAAIDALSAGRMVDARPEGLVYLDEADVNACRLFVLSAGNITQAFQQNHLDACDLEPVQDPAHAWNAVTVGAMTDKVVIDAVEYQDWTPLAVAGQLSPCSTTGVTMSTKWPNKPDLVCEGGNVGFDGHVFDEGIPDLCLLSTFVKPHEKLLVVSNGTSAATAQVARMGALALAAYPTVWPETVRALLVHSAEWTPVMRAAIDAATTKRAVGALLHRYGFGVPSIDRVLRSANDALTLVAQSVIHPYADGKTREMHLHALPWPTDVLEGLGELVVRLRVTLSYFVEPNPARRGWRSRYLYPSHALRFDVKTGDETRDQFRRRLNKQAAAEDREGATTGSDSNEWVLGDQLRHRGSLHADIWEGTAAELAERGLIGVYPVSGWWKEQKTRDRSDRGARYALVVSIETPAENVDIWTPVAQHVGVPTAAVEIEW